MVRLSIRVTPRGGRDAVDGWRGDDLCVRVSVAPEGGKANAAVERVLAEALGVPKSAVSVVRGHASRIKQVEIEGIDESRMDEAFGSPSAD